MVPGTPEADGKPVKLDATILTTDPATPRPAIVLAHGFGGTKADSEPTARTLALAGYTVIIYTARGFGASGGLIHLDNPAYEGADARKLVDLAASRPEVAKDGDDPVIGFAGASYGGALSFLAAGLDHRVDAIVAGVHLAQPAAGALPAVPGGRRGQFAGRCHSREPPGRVQTALGLLVVLQRRGRPAIRPVRQPQTRWAVRSIRPGAVSGLSHAAETGEADAKLSALLDESGLEKIVPTIQAPTLIIQGEDDTLFPLDQADANFRGLPATTPATMKWVAGGHDAEISVDPLIDDLEDMVRPLPEARRQRRRHLVFGACAGDIAAWGGSWHPRPRDPHRSVLSGPRVRSRGSAGSTQRRAAKHRGSAGWVAGGADQPSRDRRCFRAEPPAWPATRSACCPVSRPASPASR